ncbi:MFS transporter [Leuconostoc litchii]|uniref:MFS transporter n=1 Tax=Leuconostoc litchii TaxID=1981069 RepID=A0A6P2CKI4_9LACO|nr:MFS transporter [Leuconostoc litchii]TYC46239.1 MFS transporter [Leuconostoc litchii]GMA69943.1 MFS transporter [Leuconostoc litchii]
MFQAIKENSRTNNIKVRITVYLTYIVQGFALIILAQTVQQLSELWHASIAGTTAVVSAIGIGKLIAYPILGELSDHVNRKKLLTLSMVMYLIFFTILPLTKTLFLAIVITTLAGLANAALDSVAYPTLLEINRGKSSGNVLIKAMISLGEGILPIILVALLERQIWFGWLFWVATALLIIDLALMVSIDAERFYPIKRSEKTVDSQNNGVWNWRIQKILFLIYGFSAMWTMIHFTQWITRYFHIVQSFSVASSHVLMSFYSVGSLVGVGLLFVVTNRSWISEKLLLILTALGTIIGLSIVLLSHEPISASVGCFIFGISAAGGSLQLGLGQLIASDPNFSGRLTGLYFFFGSIALLIMPIATGFFASQHLRGVMLSLLVVAGLNFFIVIFNFYHTMKK